MDRETRHLSMLALMPLPALNPWNWGAVTPRAAMATGITMARIGLSAWRAYVDVARAIFRERQENMLVLAETMLVEADESVVAECADAAQATPLRVREAA